MRREEWKQDFGREGGHMAAGGNVGLRELVLHGREQSMFIYQ